MSEDAVRECRAVGRAFTGCQLTVVDEIVELLQERLEFSDKGVEVGASVKFCQTLITEQMIEGVDQQIVRAVQPRFCGSLLNHIDKIFRHFIKSARCLRQFNELFPDFLDNLLGETVQVEIDAALLIVAQSHIKEATDIFAGKRRVVDKLLIKVYPFAAHIKHKVLCPF